MNTFPPVVEQRGHLFIAMPSLRVLEFFSGIGGMRYSLDLVSKSFQSLTCPLSFHIHSCFDINPIANIVYAHNFSHSPIHKDIRTVTVAEFDTIAADLWLMSPPCQPYTRNGLQKDHKDPRAAALLHLISVISKMNHPPSYFFLENVVNFEKSQCISYLLSVLHSRSYVVQIFLACPTDIGIPNSRRRCYVLAKRDKLFPIPRYDGCLMVGGIPHVSLNGPLPLYEDSPLIISSLMIIATRAEIHQTCYNLMNNTDSFSDADGDAVDSLDMYSRRDATCRQLYHYLESDLLNVDTFLIQKSLLERRGQALDIVTSLMRKSNCFTKSYGSYLTGTGSVLLITNSSEAFDTKNDVDQLKLQSDIPLSSLTIRYFTPREISNLAGFPSSFSFPMSVSLKQQYRLLGNSLNCSVVASLLSYLFAPESRIGDVVQFSSVDVV